MTKLLKRLISFALFGVLAAAPLAAHAPIAHSAAAGRVTPFAKSAAAVVDAFHDALRRGDTATANRLLADDALIFESGEVERSKAEYAAHHLKADTEFAVGTTSTVTRRTGDSSGVIAWVASEGRTTGNFHGRPIDSTTTETMILKRFGQSWRIIQIHWSSAKAR